jgi:hypothetical protein
MAVYKISPKFDFTKISPWYMAICSNNGRMLVVSVTLWPLYLGKYLVPIVQEAGIVLRYTRKPTSVTRENANETKP